jgi:LysM repeat protein
MFMRRVWLVISLIFVFALLSTLLVSSTSAQGAGETVYVVQRGDTLFGIAIRQRTTVAAIAARNNITNVNLIFIGQRLIIPASGTPPTAVPGTAVPPTSVPPTSIPPTPGGTITYVVVPGDTLGAIARRFGTTVTAIAQLNGIVNPNLIRVGQRLLISGTPPAPTPTRTPTGTRQPTTPPTSTSFELGGHAVTFSSPQQMRDARMTWAKIQIRWSSGQPASIVDGAVNAARGNGFKVMLSIIGTPGQMGTNLTSYYQQFAAFLGSVASTYHPDAIEVWNEPNIDREWPAGRISPSSYTELLRLSYQAIKAASPQTMVISGAPAPTGFFGGGCTGTGCDDKPFMQQVANAGGGSYMDCVGIHYNEGILSPDATSGDPRGNPNHYTRYYRSMLNTYSAIFPTKPLCFTELGYLSPEGLGPLPASFAWASNTTIAQQGDWLARATVLSRQSGRVRLLIVWNVDATQYGADPQAGYAIVRNGQCSACGKLAAAMQ